MKRPKLMCVLILFFCFLIENANAQIKQSKTTAEPKKSTTIKVNTNNNIQNKLTLKITTDADCRLKIDGEDKGVLKVGELKKFYLSKGQYQIIAKSIHNDKDIFTYIKEVDEVGKEVIYNIELDYIIKLRVSNEEAELKKIAEQQEIERKKIEYNQIYYVLKDDFSSYKNGWDLSNTTDCLKKIENSKCIIDGVSCKLPQK